MPFLRRHQGPTSTVNAEVAAKIMQHIGKLQKHCGVSYYTARDWARRRTVPFKHRATVMEVLGLSEDQLPLAVEDSPLFSPTGQLTRKAASTYNLVPLLKGLMETGCEVVTHDDLVALVHATHKLPRPIDPAVIIDVLRKRHKPKK